MLRPRPLLLLLDRLRLDGRDADDHEDVCDLAAPAEVVDGLGEALRDGAHAHAPRRLLHRLVGRVA